jgi:glycerol-3-phosphate dehydrogenase (NAD(P)+)
MQVSVLGAGAWGTALATVLAARRHEVRLWTWEAEHARAMQATRENAAFLPGVPLDPSVVISSEPSEVLAGAELVLVVVPSQAVGATARRMAPHVPLGAGVVCATKGIDGETLELMSELLGRELGIGADRLCALSGPSFAREVARQLPTNLVAASTNPVLAKLVQDALVTDWLRVYTSTDPIGVEVGGALKNVIAIAAGACDGLGLGENTRAALITRGIAEMARLAHAKGGDRLTMAGLAGVGDLVLTCTGSLSRNRALGIRLGQGETVEQALAESQGVAEGYYTARSAVRLAQSLGVDLPIVAAVESVLYGGRSPVEALRSLLGRPLHAEWD